MLLVLLVEVPEDSPPGSGGSSGSSGLLSSCNRCKSSRRWSGANTDSQVSQSNIKLSTHSFLSRLNLSNLGLESLLLIIRTLDVRRVNNVLGKIQKSWCTWELLNQSKN